MSPDWGMNFAFFPLFNHIKRRDIAMTSPVEMNYDGLGEPGATKPTGWTMSFLYRTLELGTEGTDANDERIFVEDIPPVIVVAIGISFGALHGYAINPARDFGPRLFTVLAGFRNNGLTDGSMVCWVPIAAPIVGALAGAAAWDLGIRRCLPGR